MTEDIDWDAIDATWREQWKAANPGYPKEKTPFKREELESLMDVKVLYWQWERIQKFFNRKPKLNISMEDLFIDQPNMINVIQDRMERNRNAKE